MRSAFTLIEVLVVIAIISVLAIVVILTLNPGQLLMQARDGNRFSDLANIQEAIGMLQTDQPGASIGSAKTVYPSFSDSAATTTSGDQCQGLGLLSLPAAYTYHCPATSTWRNINAQGWIPANLSAISAGSPIGSWPVDPVNSSNSRLYYTYTTNGRQYELTANLESSKYKLGGANDAVGTDGGVLTTVYEKGSQFGLEPLDYGDSSLAGFWSLNEGTGTVAYDYSGNNATGSWTGTQIGSSGYYTAGHGNYAYAGDFDGNTDYVNLGTSTLQLTPGSAFSMSLWFNTPATSSESLVSHGDGAFNLYLGALNPCWAEARVANDGCSALSLATGTWYNLVVVNNIGTNVAYYLNGTLQRTRAFAHSYTYSKPLDIGNSNSEGFYFTGSLADVRIYNRALSASEIAAMFGGGK